jgi:hypothetical protein
LVGVGVGRTSRSSADPTGGDQLVDPNFAVTVAIPRGAVARWRLAERDVDGGDQPAMSTAPLPSQSRRKVPTRRRRTDGAHHVAPDR